LGSGFWRKDWFSLFFRNRPVDRTRHIFGGTTNPRLSLPPASRMKSLSTGAPEVGFASFQTCTRLAARRSSLAMAKAEFKLVCLALNLPSMERCGPVESQSGPILQKSRP
jgi:hypothetical protein